MKTFFKVLGGIIGVLAIAAGVFWFGWLRAPSPAATCAHLKALAAKGGDSEQAQILRYQTMHESECEKDWAPPKDGRLLYVKRIRCVNEASTADAVEPCFHL